MTKTTSIARLATGVRNLDAILHGGWPVGSVTVVAGPPGSGKTVLAQQICFSNVSPKSRILYFNTLSEPVAKTLRYLAQFTYFDAAALEADFKFVDLGGVLSGEHGIGLEKKNCMPWLFTDDDLEVMHRLRQVFNPHQLCNPGKIIPLRGRCRCGAVTAEDTVTPAVREAVAAALEGAHVHA